MLAVLLATLTGASSFAAEPPLVVFVASQVPPKMFIDAAGKPSGFITELTEAVVRRAGYAPDIRPMPWIRAVKLAEIGGGVVTGFSKNPDREKIFNFSIPIYEDRVQLIVLKQTHMNAETLADLKGKRLGIQRGSSYGAAFDAALADIQEDRDDGNDLRLKKLAAGHIDAAIISGGMAGLRYSAKLAGIPLTDLIAQKKAVAIDLNFIGVAKSRSDQAEILEKLNAAIAAIMSDGTATKIMMAWDGGVK